MDRERRRRELDERLDALFDFVPADGNDPTLDPYDDEVDSEDPTGGDAGAIEVAVVELDEDDAGRRGEDLVDDRPPRRPQAPVGAATDHDGDRLQKVLARAGVGSRRTCEELIEGGRVRVNGEVALLGRRVDPEHDLITVDGAPVATAEGLVHYLLNKPSGVVTTADDEHGRETVLDLVPEEPRVFPVGRLDLDTEGLLLITNDGELAYRLTHPSFGVEKEYLAKVRGRPTDGALRRLRDGVELDDGLTAPAKVSLVAPDLVRITIHEGRNRQVRRMLDAVGHPVLRLTRTRIGPITDRRLPPGRWRPLSREELQALAKTVRTTRAMRRAAERGESDNGGAERTGPQ